MVDVSEKEVTHRVAVASGIIRVNEEVMDAIFNQKVMYFFVKKCILLQFMFVFLLRKIYLCPCLDSLCPNG